MHDGSNENELKLYLTVIGVPMIQLYVYEGYQLSNTPPDLISLTLIEDGS